jgi:catechol 2,3-dioxygenase-like lactoylglutathione lyase family enzyme
MQNPLSIYTVLPVADLNRARSFYSDKLGLEPTMEKPGMLAYSGPSGYIFQLYESPTVGTDGERHRVGGNRAKCLVQGHRRQHHPHFTDRRVTGHARRTSKTTKKQRHDK